MRLLLGPEEVRFQYVDEQRLCHRNGILEHIVLVLLRGPTACGGFTARCFEASSWSSQRELLQHDLPADVVGLELAHSGPARPPRATTAASHDKSMAWQAYPRKRSG